MGIQTSTINNGPTAGFKNAVINGNFEFWQRGTTFTNTSTAASTLTLFSADRWFLQPFQTSTTHSVTVSRQAFTLGQTDVPNNPNYFLRVNATAIGTLLSLTMQARIEGVETFAGQQVTISLWAKASSATTLSARFTQRFGTGGSPSAAVDPAGSTTTWNVTTSWQKFTLTTTLPSVSGKTIGTNNDDYLMLAIAKDPVTVSSFDIAQVQVEEGPVATDFEQRPYGTELALCQRYFEKSFAVNTTPVNAAAVGFPYAASTCINSADVRPTYLPYKVPKRRTPDIGLFRDANLSSTDGVWGWYNGSGWVTPTSCVVDTSDHSGFSVRLVTAGASPNASYLAAGAWTADAELL